MLKNSDTAYGLVARSFHWIVALLIIAMIPFGWYMEGLDPAVSPNKFAMYGLHKSVGILVLTLMLCRFLWRQYNAPLPHDNPTHKTWERRIALVVHIALYVAAFLMPLSGWAMSSSGGHAVSFFGLPLPALVPENREMGALYSDLHSKIAWVIIGLVALHVAGALKHHFIDKDHTLLRMLRGTGQR